MGFAPEGPRQYAPGRRRLMSQMVKTDELSKTHLNSPGAGRAQSGHRLGNDKGFRLEALDFAGCGGRIYETTTVYRTCTVLKSVYLT